VPSYSLTTEEVQVITSWLFEPVGYLDTKSNTLNRTARQALGLESSLDVIQWVHDNGNQGWDFDNRRLDFVGNELSMIWWIRRNNGVNISRQSRPIESSSWIAILQAWDASIIAGFVRASQQTRNSNSNITICDESGNITTMPAGDQLANQQKIIAKVLGVLR